MERKFGSLRLFESKELAEDYLLAGDRLADGSYPHLDESVAYYDENGDPFIIRKFLDEDTEEVVIIPTDVKRYFRKKKYYTKNSNFSECQFSLKTDIDRFRMVYGLQSPEYDRLFDYNYGYRFMQDNCLREFCGVQRLIKKYGLKRALEIYNY